PSGRRARVGDGALHLLQRLDTVQHGVPDDEGWRSGHPDRASQLDVPIDTLVNGRVLHVGAHTVNIDASLARDLDNAVLSQPAVSLQKRIVERRIEFRALAPGGERRPRREAGRRGEGWELLVDDANVGLFLKQLEYRWEHRAG